MILVRIGLVSGLLLAGGLLACGTVVHEPPPEGVGVEHFAAPQGTSSEVIPMVSCSSRDGNKDCFCGECGCWRTQNDCGCDCGGNVE